MNGVTFGAVGTTVQGHRRVPGIHGMAIMLVIAAMMTAGCGQRTAEADVQKQTTKSNHEVVAENAATDDVVVATAAKPFDQVVTEMKSEIAAQKLVIVKEVPFQQMLGMVGVKAEPIMGFEIFHPRYGKAIYEKDRSALKEAPLRILVFSDGNETTLEYRKPSAVFASYSGLGGMGRELDQVFAEITDSVTN